MPFRRIKLASSQMNKIFHFDLLPINKSYLQVDKDQNSFTGDRENKNGNDMLILLVYLKTAQFKIFEVMWEH